MRLPEPIDEGPSGSGRAVMAVGVGLALVAGIVFVATRGGDDDPTVAGPEPSGTGTLSSDERNTGTALAGALDGEDGPFVRLDAPVALIDGAPVALAAGTPLEIEVLGRTSVAETGLVEVTVTATAGGLPADVTVVSCGTGEPATSLTVASGTTTTRQLVVPVGSVGTMCITASADAEIEAELTGFLEPSAVRPFAKPVALVDTRPGGTTDDGRFATIGVRPERSTLRIPVTERFDGLGDVGALLVAVSAVDPIDDGELAVFAAEAAVPDAAIFEYTAGTSERDTRLVPVGETGEVCVSTTGRTDVVVEILALVPASVASPIDAVPEGGCPGQTVFPDRRLVALYGTQRSARLGVLGEQSPEASVARLEEIAEPWRAGDRPVLPTFELIATLATGTPEDRGVYNIQSSPEFVQEYLDVARRHGYYLILDLQAGQSDFLTEAKHYEEFLRQPDVGLALDPEWRTEPPARPKGGFVGQVDAAEVNSVIEYVAGLVAEEHLPEKLVVVHQFQDRMITNKSELVELPGVALTIHMDGFGERAEKLNSYDIVRVAPPLNMGLKLFFDEDIDMVAAADVLGGLFQPIPDMITYQ